MKRGAKRNAKALWISRQPLALLDLCFFSASNSALAVGKIRRDFCKAQSSISDDRWFLLFLVGQQNFGARCGVAENNSSSGSSLDRVHALRCGSSPGFF
jgi:hypothetical protein